MAKPAEFGSSAAASSRHEELGVTRWRYKTWRGRYYNSNSMTIEEVKMLDEDDEGDEEEGEDGFVLDEAEEAAEDEDEE